MPQPKNESKGIMLLKKGQKGIFHAIFSRIGLVIVLLLVQVAFMLGFFIWLQSYLPHAVGISIVLTLVMILYLLNKDLSQSARITWIIIISLLPVFGVLLFLFTQSNLGHRILKKMSTRVIGEAKETIPQNKDVEEELRKENPNVYALSRYMRKSGCHPIYKNTRITYFPLGEDKFKELLIQLEQAKSFIFLEYFILDEGTMWGEILEILARKAKEGVEVRLMYDGTCELALLPRDYPKRIEKLGIQCKVFAPIKPFVSTHYNYRDHRKILVIDGHTAFTGALTLPTNILI